MLVEALSLSPNVLFAGGFAATAACSLGLTGLLTRLAYRFGWVKKPTSARHVHTKAIPRLGGIAIFLTTISAVGLGIAGCRATGYDDHALLRLAHILLPASCLFLVGLIDDLKPLPAKLKLACQIGSGAWLYLQGYSVLSIALPGSSLLLRLFELCATVAWVVWITNAVNLIDGLDGLAAGSSLFSMLTLFIAAYLHGNHVVTLGTALLGGAVLGFLRYNFNPASIFLGDGGSLFIGFLLSALGLMDAGHRSSLHVGAALSAVALGLPLMEVLVSVSRRFLSRKRLFEPDRMHMHHRLLDLGLSHRQTVLVLYAVSGGFGLLALLLVDPTWQGVLLAYALLVLLAGLGIMRLGYAEFAELGRLPLRMLQQRRVIANTVTVSRAVQMLQSASNLEQIRGALETGFPVECFDAMSLALVSRRDVQISHEFRIQSARPEHPRLTKSARPKARLVMELESSDLCGSLEFVVSSQQEHMMLNLGQIFGKLHPALDDAIVRLSGKKPAGLLEMHAPLLNTSHLQEMTAWQLVN